MPPASVQDPRTFAPTGTLPLRGALLFTMLLFGALLVVAILLPLFAGPLYLNNPILHTAVETLGAAPAVAFAVLLLAQCRQGDREPHLYLVALGLLAMGILDGFHALADGTAPGFVWLRCLAAISGGLFPALMWLGWGERLQRIGLHRAVIAAAVAIGAFFLLRPHALPALDAAGDFVPGLKVVNIVSGLLAFAAFAFFIRRYTVTRDAENLVFAAFYLVLGSSSLIFPFSRLWDGEWWLWHGIRLVAYAVMIQYLLSSHVGLLHAMRLEIAERRATEARIEFLAYHDALTELPNRLLAKDHMEMAVSYADRSGNKVALLFLDLDNFKTINDSLGHSVGDALLKAVAARLSDCVRHTDTLAHLGGDEFLIVLSDVHNTDVISDISEHLLEQLANPFDVGGHDLSTSFSLGIAVYPDDGDNFETLLMKADTAMYHAKDAGRNTYRYHTEKMNLDAVEHLQIRNSLRKALERGEFVLHYQPQIELETQMITGVEALIRWNHPVFGLVAPFRFIPIAEDSGLIVPIGDWVIAEACRQAAAWQRAGLPRMTVAVNLSAVQFRRGNLEKSIQQALAETGLDAECLELELTESILIQDTEKMLAKVRQLKALGVKLSVDDFGTGYSSLAYLKRFNVDKLKIDQSFVRDMIDDPNDAVIVDAIVQMARSL
ncbi:MAG: putative bifunctional diguanylate cyclase/phosphodiesterase, partial [Gammaproteobacteria bacterium]